MAVARYCSGKAICIRHVPASHENNRLSRPDRQTGRSARNDEELEHDRRDRPDFERPGEEPLFPKPCLPAT